MLDQLGEGVLLDTNVYIDWADNGWLELRSVLREAQVDVYLCPSVVLELLDDYWTCRQRKLPRSKKALRLALRHADRMLQPEGATVRSALGLDAEYDGPLSPRNLRSCMEFCLTLTVGQRSARRDGSRSFDLDAFLSELDQYREQYLGGREAFRDDIIGRFGIPGGRGFPPKHLRELREYLGGADWARTYIRNMLKGMIDNVDETLVIDATGLVSARLAFDTAVVESMLIDGYNPRKHRGDCFDCGVLTYLADQGLHLITADQRLVQRTTRTAQAGRILSVRELCG